jgi:hypothetical protein
VIAQDKAPYCQPFRGPRRLGQCDTRVVAYTTISAYAIGWPPGSSATATTAEGVLEVSKEGGAWRGRWIGGVPIEIPGGRDLQVHECLSGWTQRRQKLGAHYVLVARGLAKRLQPLDAWCKERAELSIVDDYFWIENAVWTDRRSEYVAMPFIPEFDEPGKDLQEVARCERECREAQVRLEAAQAKRSLALVDATRERSRRRLAQTAGLSFARIQQIIRTSA